ncbi:M2 family metallopeptidase [bacterium]|nr:M2 family metallopeptidase [bacterium]
MTNIEDYKVLRDEFGKELEVLVYEAELSGWNFYTNSTDENLSIYTLAQEKMSNLYKNEDLYEKFKKIKEKGFANKHLAKQIKDIVKAFYNEIESGQELKALRDKENEISAKYNSYVLTIDDKPVSKSEIMKILETEKDIEIRKKAYEANVKAGDIIAKDLVELVKLRNDYAKLKGFDNYFDYMVEETYDIKPEKLSELLNGVYGKLKSKCIEFDKKRKSELSLEFGISSEQLFDFHYGLLPQNSNESKVNSYIKTKEQVVEIAKNVYGQMGYNVDNMGITLDLFPRKNKNTHGFAFCIKPGKDARILANLTNNVKSLDTILHELGHCVYDIGIDSRLPFIEQDCSSPVMTEAIAMMMGDLPKSEKILEDIVPDEVLEGFMNELKEDDARFVTRSLQIINFEKEMYANPEQDLKVLWSNMKKTFLFRGENTELNNEWATIPHYLSHPGYYQNYFRAALLKAQIYGAMTKELGQISKNQHTTEFLNEKLFKYGASLLEEDIIESVTGKPLSEDDFCNRF